MIDVVAVCGPTAAGKTALGVALARRLGGEIVSADAFAVYRGMDIGTAKPDAATRASVPHHLLDVADPTGRYSAGTFVRDADAAIAAISGRGALPIIVGGTHFYVRALLVGLFPEPGPAAGLRARLEEEWLADPVRLFASLQSVDPESAARIQPTDRQRVLRALEVSLAAGRPMSELWRAHGGTGPRYRCLMFGLDPPRPDLRVTIRQRTERMFAEGLVGEVEGLLARGVSPEAHAMKAIGYRECVRLLRGEIGESAAREAVVTATGQFAKRQMTWLRHERGVAWLTWSNGVPIEEAARGVEAFRGTDAGQG